MPMSQADAFVSKWMFVNLNGSGWGAVAGVVAAAASATPATAALQIIPMWLFMAFAPFLPRFALAIDVLLWLRRYAEWNPSRAQSSLNPHDEPRARIDCGGLHRESAGLRQKQKPGARPGFHEILVAGARFKLFHWCGFH